VSVRSVYVRFEDLDGVASAAAQRQWERVRAITTRVPSDGPLRERLDAFVEQRCRVLELLAPVRRVAEVQERSSPGLASLLTWARSLARREVAQVFAPELRDTSRRGRDALLDALDVAAGTTTWEALRHHRGLPEPAARRVVATMLDALLTRAGEPDQER
jgi:AcrR family transcriptional regulator